MSEALGPSTQEVRSGCRVRAPLTSDGPRRIELNWSELN